MRHNGHSSWLSGAGPTTGPGDRVRALTSAEKVKKRYKRPARGVTWAARQGAEPTGTGRGRRPAPRRAPPRPQKTARCRRTRTHRGTATGRRKGPGWGTAAPGWGKE